VKAAKSRRVSYFSYCLFGLSLERALMSADAKCQLDSGKRRRREARLARRIDMSPTMISVQGLMPTEPARQSSGRAR
jgi:hypothetical protein